MRRVSNGTALLGGSPFRLIRLSSAGSNLLDQWLTGAATEPSPAADKLRGRLVSAGMAHPVADASSPHPTVGFVVPVYEDAIGLAELLRALRGEFPEAPIVVVDDASPNGSEIENVAADHRARFVPLPTNRGPAAARNVGWRQMIEAPLGPTPRPEVVFFVDADVVPTPGAARLVLTHLNDAAVVAVAPRMRPEPGPTLVDSYESVSSPLDLGPEAGPVGPGHRTTYLPSAALAIRTHAVESAGGFDEAMRFGEDVDLVWRLHADGAAMRYEPAAVFLHRNRRSVRDMLRRRFGYGSSAAPLAARHGNLVTPLRLPATMLAGWLVALFGGRPGKVAGLMGFGATVVGLTKKFDGKIDSPRAEAIRLAGKAHLGVASALVNASNRHYVPLMLVTRPTRRLFLVGAVIPPLIDWLRVRPHHDPLTHVVLATLDDATYAASTWAGAWRERSPGALLPDVSMRSSVHD